MLLYDIDLESSDDWVIVPDCPVCHDDISRVYTDNILIREVTEHHLEIVDEDRAWSTPEPDTWDIRRDTVCIVEPCDHKFSDEKEFYYYVLSYRWLHEVFEEMEFAEIPKHPTREALRRQRDKLSNLRLE